MNFQRFWIYLGAMVCIAGNSFAQELASADLTELSLNDLLNVEVTSVFRAPSRLSTAPAAITVITGEDIQRIGATTIPDALRLVPGLQVAQVDAHTWAVSARGFNEVFANKLLVMIDGRSVYTPLFSGVFWDVQDTLLQDIDRIEVIRGPGASLWGANAVNGVINIITHRAKDTQGLLVSAGTGTEDLASFDIRYGAKLSDEAHARVYAKYLNRDHSATPDDGKANDRWDMYRGGFRLDWEPEEPTLVTVQGDVYTGTLDQTYFVPTFAPPFRAALDDDYEVFGGNLLGRWTRSFSDDAEAQLQVYFDHTSRNTPLFEVQRITGDLDFQYLFRLGEKQMVTWGLGYRRTEDDAQNTTSVSLVPRKRALNLYSAFIQDEIALFREEVTLTLGSKIEHNDFTGIEVQPNIRLAWTPRTNSVLWGAVSRAVRTPSRAEDDVVLNLPGAPPGSATILGNDRFESENLIAYEIGYRCQPFSKMTLEVSTFYNVYDDLRNFRSLTGVPGSPSTAMNELEGETYGVEIATVHQLHEQWRVQLGYTFLEMELHLANSNTAGSERNSPHHQVFARSSVDFGRKRDFGHELKFDTFLRFVDRIQVGGDQVPKYFSADVRLAWRPSRNWEISIVGQNLLDNQHAEFYPTTIATQRAEIERSVYGKITFEF